MLLVLVVLRKFVNLGLREFVRDNMELKYKNIYD